MTGNSRPTFLFVVLACTALSLLCFRNTLFYDFLKWDDPVYILNDPLIQQPSFSNLIKIWTSAHHAAWYPITRLSHAIDLWLFGQDAFYHRLTNLLIHIGNGVLVYYLARQLIQLGMPTASPGKAYIAALLAALLFIVHPQHIEVVVWITQRNELLATLFFIAALLAYCQYLGHNKPSRKYLALVCALLAMIAKPSAVGIPVVLVVLDLMHRKDFQRRDHSCFSAAGKSILDKIPFFAASIFITFVTISVNKNSYALKLHDIYDIPHRLCYAGYNIIDFIYRFLIPVDLTPVVAFPLWIRILSPLSWFPLIAIVLLCVLALLLTRRQQSAWPLLLFAYLALIWPTSGWMMFGTYSAANRYMYLPSSLLIAYIAPLIYLLMPAGRRGMVAMSTGCLLLILASTRLTAAQAAHWQDDERLWSYVVTTQPDSSTAWVNYGSFNVAQGKISVEAAIKILEAAVIMEPIYIGFDNLLKLYAVQGDEQKLLYTHTRISHFYPHYSGTSRAVLGIHLLNKNYTAAGERLVLDGIRKNPALCIDLAEHHSILAPQISMNISSELLAILQKAREKGICASSEPI